MRDVKKLISSIEKWISQVISASGAGGVVLGLSGGIDSALSAALLKGALGAERVLAVRMPCHSLPQDGEHAELVATTLGIQLVDVDLSKTFDTFQEAVSQNTGSKNAELVTANVKPRLRMMTLYSLAQSRGWLVCGNSNKDEMTVGYFTKHGDSGCDIMPLVDLTKGEVRAMAREMGVPSAILDKAPSAGLWEGQTDEQEMGLTYAEIDAYIENTLNDELIRTKIQRRERQSQHKRQMPQMCVLKELSI